MNLLEKMVIKHEAEISVLGSKWKDTFFQPVEERERLNEENRNKIKDIRIIINTLKKAINAIDELEFTSGRVYAKEINDEL